VRLVKEGMVVSKVKRNSESLNEPESILPDVQQYEHTEQVFIKEEMLQSKQIRNSCNLCDKTVLFSVPRVDNR